MVGGNLVCSCRRGHQERPLLGREHRRQLLGRGHKRTRRTRTGCVRNRHRNEPLFLLEAPRRKHLQASRAAVDKTIKTSANRLWPSTDSPVRVRPCPFVSAAQKNAAVLFHRLVRPLRQENRSFASRRMTMGGSRMTREAQDHGDLTMTACPHARTASDA